MANTTYKTPTIYINVGIGLFFTVISITITAQTGTTNSKEIEQIDHIEVYGETGTGDTAFIYFKNGKIEKKFLKTREDNLLFHKQYSKVLSKNELSTEPISSHYKLQNDIPEELLEFTISNEYIWITLKNGKKEKYNLKNKIQKEEYEKKYGKVLESKD